MRRGLLLVTLLLIPPPAAMLRAQVEVPAGENLLTWMGLAPGDSMAFVDGRGEVICAWVGEKPRRLGGKLWVPLQGLRWPGFPSDSQILLPLDGSLAFGVIRTPGPRPRIDDLLESGTDSLHFLRGRMLPVRSAPFPADGWYGVGGTPANPAVLYYVWCSLCSDAGTIVVLDRGRGIRLIETTTITGRESLTRARESC